MAFATLPAPPAASGPALSLKAQADFGAVPLYFISNQGQADIEARFYAISPAFTLWLTRKGLVFDRIAGADGGASVQASSELHFIGADPQVKVIAADPSDYRVSYFCGRDESEWQTDIPTAQAVLYKNLYVGIDLKVYGSAGQVEYDWIVSPGARLDRIGWTYRGAVRADLDRDGNLAVESPAGRLLHRKPSAHQIIAGRRVEVEVAFRAKDGGAYGFEVGAYDPRFELVIDPLVLAYGTYLGGHDDDYGLKVAVDPTGAAYVSGVTISNDFPPATQKLPRRDLFITKFSSDGKSLIYTAFFPAAFEAEVLGMRVDAKGFVYLAGGTTTSKFPIKNAFQSSYGGGQADGVILKLAKSGKSLVYSSYLGGSALDCGMALWVDAAGAAYVGGFTDSKNFPTKNGYQKTFGGVTDGFVAKVSPLGTSLVYSTLLGRSSFQEIIGMDGDATGAVTAVGYTGSRNYPVKSGFQKTFGGGAYDGFVTQLTPAGDSLAFSSYLGGSNSDLALNVALDSSRAVYVVGQTQGTFPVKNAFQKTRKGSYDSFITKIEASGKALVYSSFLGGSGVDEALGVAVTAAGAACITGYTDSANFPVKTPFQPGLRGKYDAFLTIVDPSGLKLAYSTFLGGIYRDAGYGIALDEDGAIYLTGYTNSTDFPLFVPYQGALAGRMDAFVLKLFMGKSGRSE
jgi:hypothetical protein